MTEEDKIKRRAYTRSCYGNLSEDAKNKKREYSKNSYHMIIKAC